MWSVNFRGRGEKCKPYHCPIQAMSFLWGEFRSAGLSHRPLHLPQYTCRESRGSLMGKGPGFFFVFSFFKLIYCEIAHEPVWTGEKQRERDRENPKQVPRAVSADPTRGSILQTSRSWPELKSRVGRQTHWASQAPPDLGSFSQIENKSISPRRRKEEVLCSVKGACRRN